MVLVEGGFILVVVFKEDYFVVDNDNFGVEGCWWGVVWNVDFIGFKVVICFFVGI